MDKAATITTSDDQVASIAKRVLPCLPPIFRHCLGYESETRYTLGLPWVKGDWVYATNGHWIVRAAKTDAVTEVLGEVTGRSPVPW